jgi:hypothetical protein
LGGCESGLCLSYYKGCDNFTAFPMGVKIICCVYTLFE